MPTRRDVRRDAEGNQSRYWKHNVDRSLVRIHFVNAVPSIA